MKTTLLIVLLMTCPLIAAPAEASAAAPAPAPALAADGPADDDGPICWQIDPFSIPPIDVWFC